ncbi:ABC transporter permease [Roseateles saccharophilus]|uniref:L-arginine ABC transporter membrane protein /L-ornithine ABC transporter membrane protein n=1 Tax=Roseateles saccharophilus TaxID=304 RepID=A0A4R3V9Z2_ROSSA|nr:ABC transporter permease [Roseateles saccharophilus]MDG0832581.1 ABC transporter permease [Roseateles saccharophilus]TCV00318.1 L-arginine ABC transporter membrane protein /L-ornithine ABC transporter membrane protein [Roseateles saccharophilus]
MNFDAIAENLPLYLGGLVVTLQLLALSLVGGMLLAVPLAIVRTVFRGWPSRLVWVYTYAFRGTPMLVQLFLIYYGLAQFDAVRDSWAWPWLSSATFCAWLTFTLNTAAYTTEIIAGSIRALPAGEIEAAKALGMSRGLMLRRIVLPAALRRALPAYGNEAIFMLHGTSLASTVTLVDTTGAAQMVYAKYYLPFEAFITAGAFYLVLTLSLVGLFRWAEGRWLKPMMSR